MEDKNEQEEVKIQSWSVVFTVLLANILKNLLVKYLYLFLDFCKKQIFGEQKKP
jgi:hypothetical protein